MERPSQEQRLSSDLPPYTSSTSFHKTRPSQLSRASTPYDTPVDDLFALGQPRHQRFVLADPVAFSYLEEDRHTIVLERSRYLQGYQLYIVEQWACSRSHPTFAIIAYTGDGSHHIKAGVLSVPADEDSWSPRLRVYFKSLAQYHAQRKDTQLGALMVTNLSTFPSSLTIVLVPDGDLHKHREDFFVAENLKRLGCSGRVGLSLAEPSGATQAKFYQLYKVSEKISLFAAVIELVKLCQVALMLFNCLEAEYADGLLCDITEGAMRTWWAQIGTDLYNVEPNDGVLGPTSVAAVLGTLIGARNRLNAVVAPVPKDVFDVETTKRAIAAFQKIQRLPRTRRLDRHTLDRLHKATAKQAAGERWAVPRAVKSTVAELSGRGGEMVMDMVSRGDKANMTEVETVDIEAFAHLVKGERAKWVWQGKPRKRTTRDMFNEIPEDDVFSPQSPQQQKDIASRQLRPNLSRINTLNDSKPPPPYHAKPSEPTPSDAGQDNDQLPKHGTFQRAKGRLKGAVGLRNQPVEDLRDGNSSSRDVNGRSAEPQGSEPESPSSVRGSMEWHKESEYRPGLAPRYHTTMTDTPFDSTEELSRSQIMEKESELGAPSQEPTFYDSDVDPLAAVQTVTTQNNVSTTAPDQEETDTQYHRRPRSLPGRMIQDGVGHNESWWPRQLSFSTASKAILASSSTPENRPLSTQDNLPRNHKTDLKAELLRSDTAVTLRSEIETIQSTTAKWVTTRIDQVEDLSLMASQDADQLNSLYHPRKQELQSLQQQTREIIAEERRKLSEAVRDLDTLRQKLEYELSSLKGKVEDVEAAVDEFEKQVLYTEARVGELVRSNERPGWFSWVGRLDLFSFSKKPDTQSSS